MTVCVCVLVPAGSKVTSLCLRQAFVSLFLRSSVGYPRTALFISKLENSGAWNLVCCRAWSMIHCFPFVICCLFYSGECGGRVLYKNFLPNRCANACPNRASHKRRSAKIFQGNDFEAFLGWENLTNSHWNSEMFRKRSLHLFASPGLQTGCIGFDLTVSEVLHGLEPSSYNYRRHWTHCGRNECELVHRRETDPTQKIRRSWNRHTISCVRYLINAFHAILPQKMKVEAVKTELAYETTPKLYKI